MKNSAVAQQSAAQDSGRIAARFAALKAKKQGGLVTTLSETGQQWDVPNGWAPLQWMAYKGIKNYGHTKDTIKPQVDVYTIDGKDVIVGTVGGAA